MRRLLARAAPLLLSLPLLLAGPAGAGAATFTDSAGRVVTLPERVGRAFAAGPPASASVLVVAPAKLAGWIRAPSAEARPFLPETSRDLPAVGRLTGRADRADLDTLRRAAPDLIVDVGTVDAAYAGLADRVQAESGIPYVLLDGSLAGTPRLLRTLGALLGEPARGERLAAWAEAALADVAGRLAAAPAAAPPRAYYARGADGLETAGGLINVEILGTLGAENVAAGVGPGWRKVTAAEVAGWRPEVMLTQDPAMPAHAAAEPLWADLPAVRAGRVLVAPSLPFGWLEGPPGPNRLIGLHWLGSRLHPDRFPDDLAARTREFYALFYGVQLDAAMTSRLLAPGT